MIINVSRARSFDNCKRKAFNNYHRGLEGPRSMNLVDGGAFHAGVAKGRATKDWQLAKLEAKRLFDEDVKKSAIPEEQIYLQEQHWELTSAMLSCFEEQYQHEEYQVIQPECEFDVPLEGSWHNCAFLHHVDDGKEVWGPPKAESILAKRVFSPHPEVVDQDCPCYQPHRMVGRTDALVMWNGNLWLDDYKTSSIDGVQFWDQWPLDLQMSVYMAGIWRTLKIRPRGFMIHMMYKPSEAQVASWNSRRKNGPGKEQKDYVRLSREAFLRTEEDLMRAEAQMLDIAREWESHLLSGHRQERIPFPMTPSSHTCMMYNRRCDYYLACLNHEAPGEWDVFGQRLGDYVDEKLVQLVGARL